MAKCSEIDCSKSAEKRGMCSAHYQRWRKVNGKPCTADGCSEGEKARGLCSGHYTAWKRRHLPPCIGPDCTNTSITWEHELCSGHDAQRREGKKLMPLRVFRYDVECAVEGCPERAGSDHLCPLHYQRRWRKVADWNSLVIKRPARAKGEGTINADGYVMVKVKRADGAWRTKGMHVVEFERSCGRELVSGEEVHHRNGNRQDNRTTGEPVMTAEGRLITGNLELYSTRQPRGQEIGPKVDWGVELIETYIDLLDDNRLRVVVKLGRRARTVLSARSRAAATGKKSEC